MKKKALISTSIKYGIAGGVIAILLFTVLYFAGDNPILGIKLFDFVLIPLFVFFTIKEFRDYRNHRQLTFGQGMTAGALTYTTVALLSAVFVYVFLKFIDSDLFFKYIEDELTILRQDPDKWIKQIGEAEYLAEIDKIKSISIAKVAVDDFLKKVLIGLLLTPVISVFLKRQ